MYSCCCCCSVAKLCLILREHTDCSRPGIPVPHHLLEFAQVHVHWVGGAIQPSHPLPSASPPAFNLSSIRVLSIESAVCIRWPKYRRFSISLLPHIKQIASGKLLSITGSSAQYSVMTWRDGMGEMGGRLKLEGTYVYLLADSCCTAETDTIL